MAKSDQNPAKARFSARLAAVQALYEQSQNSRDIKALIKDYLSKQPEGEGTDEIYSKPDGALLKAVLTGVQDRRDDIDHMIEVNLQGKDVEPLLKAVLRAGSYEAMAHQDTDFAIIINDYLNITHSFYGDSEVKLVNAILDKTAKNTR